MRGEAEKHERSQITLRPFFANLRARGDYPLEPGLFSPWQKVRGVGASVAQGVSKELTRSLMSTGAEEPRPQLWVITTPMSLFWGSTHIIVLKMPDQK